MKAREASGEPWTGPAYRFIALLGRSADCARRSSSSRQFHFRLTLRDSGFTHQNPMKSRAITSTTPTMITTAGAMSNVVPFFLSSL